MNKRLLSFLGDLAKTRGQVYYQPESGNVENLANFQSEVDEIKDLEAEEVLQIIGTPHRESMSGYGHVDLIKVELTAKGVKWLSQHNAETHMTNDLHLTRLGKLFKAVEGSEDNLIDLSAVLKGEAISEREVWDEANYLEGENWLTIEADEAPLVRLTHTGIKTVKTRLARTSRLTDHESLTDVPQQIIEDHRELRVFLCHSLDDKPAVRDLHKALKLYNGIQPWLDEIDLLPGQDWDLEIRKAVKRADIVLVCLSLSSITKRGYIQKEIKYALDVADEQPEGSIFLIPLRLEECVAPDRLRNRQWVDYFSPTGHEQLMSALRSRAKEIGVTIKGAHH